MDWKKFLKILAKNAAALVIGAIVGAAVLNVFVFTVWMPNNSPDVGLGVIALLPVLVIIYAVLGGIIGALMGLIIYNLFFRKKK
ncbi:MAG: hypothetical protein JW791_04625 [Nanoarchaeota archaeon]|nr:hypothetical protein [Nanoarchaeota archaeon]